MIENLVIVGIPKDEKAISDILAVVKDHSWSNEAKEAWATDSELKYVWYDTKYGQYVMGRKLPSLDSVDIKTYEEILSWRK